MALNLGPLNVLLNLKGARRFNQDAEKATSSVNNIVGSIKNLAGAYATMETAKKAFDLSQEAAAFADAAAIFRHSGGNLDALRESVRGTVSDFELVKKANLAKTMGIPSEAMGTLAQAAMAASKATGESVDFMLDSIVRGVARGSPLILDNLGIIISIEEANAAYAATLGKTTGELTKNEQAQAVLKATLAAVGPQIKNAADAGANAAEVYAQLTASLQNLTVLLGQSLSPAVSWFTKQLVQAIEFYQEFLSQGDTSDSAERAMDAIADKTRIVSDQLKKARQQLKGFQEAQLTGTVPEHIRTVLPGLRGLSEEAALGALEYNIDELKDKLSRLAKQARGVGVSRVGAVMGPMAPMAPTGIGAAPVAPVAATAKAVEANVTSRLVGVMDVGADMMQSEFDDLMSSFGFANEIVIDHAEALDKATIAATKFADDLGFAISAALSGRAGATFGPELGTMIGTAIGNVLAPGVGGGAGGMIGSALGSIAGDAFDSLVQSLGVLTPIFDLFADLMRTLAPPLKVLGYAVQVIADSIGAMLVPVMDVLANLLGKLLYPVAILIQALLPLINIVSVVVSVISMWLAPTLGIVSGLFSFLGEYVLVPIAKVFITAYNAVADFVNGLINWVRGIEIAGARPFAEFGVLMTKLSTDVADYSTIISDENDARAEATEGLREFNDELRNVPIGVKRLRALQFTATRGSVAFPGRFSAPAFGA